MIECYYKWCRYHTKYEPMCDQGECLATAEKLVIFEELRTRELADERED